MANKFKPISISLSPNVQKDDVVLALKLLFQPWKWKRGSAIKKFEEEFKKYLGVKYAFSFNSGRSSLFAILKALNLPEKSDVLLQAFTCNAVPNPVLWAGLHPVYIDCADDFNSEVESYKVQSYKAAIVQHTFGLPADMETIMRHKKGIIIEDCAHALGAEINGKKVGTFGDAAFFSFARDKVISCVYGGMAVTNNDEIGQKLEQLQKEFGQPSLVWIFQQLLHPILLHYIILPLYDFLDLGKLFLIGSQWFHVLSKAVSWQEKRGLKPNYFPKALPNALAAMALNQFNKLEMFNAHRQKITNFYFEQLKNTQFILPSNDGTFLRFAVRHPKAHEVIYEAWHKENMLLGDWYTSVVAPIDTQLDNIAYISGSCPNAENLAQKTLNLPTHVNISPEDAQRIVTFLKQWN
jgi:perosamine synthetase